jgi:basic membrane protein A
VTDAAQAADAVKAKMMAGSVRHLQGPELKDNKGKVGHRQGQDFKQTDLELEKMNYLVEGVIGKI